MLLRIKRPLAGAVDGIDLTQFEPHAVYSIATELAAFLLAIDAAEPVDEHAQPTALEMKRRYAGTVYRSVAADRAKWHGPERRGTKR